MTAMEVEALQRDGFVVLENVIPTAALAPLRRQLAPYLQGRYPGRNDFEGRHSERVYALLAKAPAVAALVEHPRVLALVDAVLPPHYLLSALLAIQVHPGETPQAFHVDDAAGGFPLAAPRPPMGVSAIWALDDFTATNGATEIAPGSHRWAAMADGSPDRARAGREAVKVLMPAGSVLVFLGNVLHRGGANSASRSRLAVTPQYCAPWMRQIESMLLAVPPATAARYSKRIRELLGYSIVAPGFMGYVDGRHPERLLERTP
jgi:ectoine hydroxylase-related dioxygenase (phytanoyl-CoA dioxygenase family)